MSASSTAVVSPASAAATRPSLGLRAALLLSLLIAVVLAALAFWPAKAWAPPRRPGVAAPVVFDELVTPPPAVDPSAADSAAHQ